MEGGRSRVCRAGKVKAFRNYTLAYLIEYQGQDRYGYSELGTGLE